MAESITTTKLGSAPINGKRHVVLILSDTGSEIGVAMRPEQAEVFVQNILEIVQDIRKEENSIN